MLHGLRSSLVGRAVVVAAVLLPAPPDLRAESTLLENWLAAIRGEVPCERAVGGFVGTAYDWSHMSFFQVSWQALFDYENIWLHGVPEGLGLRLEGNLGAATGTEFSGERLIASGGFLAVYELKQWGSRDVYPYVEAGVGVIYTDFQRAEQAFRWNFNPVAGVGLRMGRNFVTLRLHHVSNGGLDDDNRGINSIVLGFGTYFGGH